MPNDMQRLAQRLAKEGAICTPEAELHRWLKDVHTLFQDLQGWIAPLIQSRVASFTGRVEQNTGDPKEKRIRFERPSFTIQFSQRKAVFRPSAIGRIDLLIHGHEEAKSYQVLRVPGEGWRLAEKGGEVQIPFTEDALANFLNRWV